MAPDDEELDDGGDGDVEVVQVPITDELDLHTFLPRDVPSLIPEYLDECVRLGFRQVRIVHGKGRGVLRRAVHAALERHPRVVGFRQAESFAGSWGATVVSLKIDNPAPPEADDDRNDDRGDP
jgi:dsDNA-specific endonuclease/ATPase MutS2